MSSLPAGQVSRSGPEGPSRLSSASVVPAASRLPAAVKGAFPGRDVREILSIYLSLTKPRIIQLLLVTTVPSMVIAADGWPGTWLVVATLLGGTLSAASANTINNYFDRDIDRIMLRTRQRPLARGVISPAAALRFGIVLGAAGFVWLALFTNLLAALLATSAILFYVFVYTLGLKRRTNQAVVIGGAAGCVPVLAGWAAVTGTIEPVAWALFAIIFYWTP
ncbi:MAG: heme o synthase, partial [Actinomycetota bacterium]|nr:heme o synthase [Actinomycetota bacterium]